MSGKSLITGVACHHYNTNVRAGNARIFPESYKQPLKMQDTVTMQAAIEASMKEMDFLKVSIQDLWRDMQDTIEPLQAGPAATATIEELLVSIENF